MSKPRSTAVSIEWHVAQVDGVRALADDHEHLVRDGSTSFPLGFPQEDADDERESSSNGAIATDLAEAGQPGTSASTLTPSVQVYNATDSPHYSALLLSLSQAKDDLNAQLTRWKDVIGDGEKSKEVLPHGVTEKSQGMGKAMMMVQAAKLADGRAEQDYGSASRRSGTRPGSGGGSLGGGAGNPGVVLGLPTDDQESDEDEDEVVVE